MVIKMECIDCGGYVEKGQKYCQECIDENPKLKIVKRDTCTCWAGICVKHIGD